MGSQGVRPSQFSGLVVGLRAGRVRATIGGMRMTATRWLCTAAFFLAISAITATPAGAQANPATPPHSPHPKATAEEHCRRQSDFCRHLRRLPRCGWQRVERSEYSRCGRADGTGRGVRKDSRRRDRIGDAGVYGAGRRNGLEDRGLRDDARPRGQGRGHRRSAKRQGDLRVEQMRNMPRDRF